MNKRTLARFLKFETDDHEMEAKICKAMEELNNSDYIIDDVKMTNIQVTKYYSYILCTILHSYYTD